MCLQAFNMHLHKKVQIKLTTQNQTKNKDKPITILSWTCYWRTEKLLL